MDLDMARLAEPHVLRLDGCWTIARAQELKRALVDALRGGDSITIEVEGLTEVDLSALQLLCSAHRSSFRLGKHLALSGKHTEIFKRAVREVGLARTLGCHKDPHKSCLWIGDWKS